MTAKTIRIRTNRLKQNLKEHRGYAKYIEKGKGLIRDDNFPLTFKEWKQEIKKWKRMGKG